MANFRISDLTAVSAYADAQEFEVNDSGTSKKITGTQLKAGVLTNPTVTGTVTADGLTVGDVSYAGNAIIKTQVEGSDAGNYDSGLQMRSHNNDFGGTIALESRSGINDVVAFKYHNNSTAGVRAMAIDATNGDISFYEDTGTTPKLFWDASAESLSIGTYNGAGTPSGSLFVQTNASGHAIHIEEPDTGAESWQVGVNVDGDLGFFNSQTTTASVTFDDAGNVGIGTTSPSSKLHVNGDSTFGGAITEGVYNLTGTALDPSNGTIQTKTLSANTTFTDNVSAGESMTLMIDDGAGYVITWPSIAWVNNGGTVPTLSTTVYTVVALWKVGSTLYGALVGDGS